MIFEAASLQELAKPFNESTAKEQQAERCMDKAFDGNKTTLSEIRKPLQDVAKTSDVNGSGMSEKRAEQYFSKKFDSSDIEKTQGLTGLEKLRIKLETGWSDAIIDHIESKEQYEIYKNAGLREAEINGRLCLCKEIDMDYIDPKTGMTNRELMAKGRSPIDVKTGERIELHHMGQGYDAPFAELCADSEHGDGNYSVLHTKSEGSWRNDPALKNQYNNIDRPDHWKARAEAKSV